MAVSAPTSLFQDAAKILYRKAEQRGDGGFLLVSKCAVRSRGIARLGIAGSAERSFRLRLPGLSTLNFPQADLDRRVRRVCRVYLTAKEYSGEQSN
jgi:hypothetical protein